VFVLRVCQAGVARAGALHKTLVNIVLTVVMMWAVIYHMRNGYYIRWHPGDCRSSALFEVLSSGIIKTMPRPFRDSLLLLLLLLLCRARLEVTRENL
jgi:hypothetical protein